MGKGLVLPGYTRRCPGMGLDVEFFWQDTSRGRMFYIALETMRRQVCEFTTAVLLQLNGWKSIKKMISKDPIFTTLEDTSV